MADTETELEEALATVNKGIRALQKEAQETQDDARLAQLRQAYESLKASRAQIVQWRIEAAAKSINDAAEKVMHLAIRAERERVENVLKGLAGRIKAIVRSVRKMEKEVEEEPEIIRLPRSELAPPVMKAAVENDPVLMRYAGRKRNVYGHLVGRMQRSLNSSGHGAGAVDLDFGSTTAKALESWHKATGFDEPAALSLNEWRMLTGEDAPDLFDICAQVTAAFEGHGFDRIVGDFDGAVATWGYHGYTLRYGNLQNVLKLTEERAPGAMVEAFGEQKGAALQDMLRMDLPAQCAWGKKNLLQENGAIRRDWANGFAVLGARPACQDAQLAWSRAEFWEKRAVPQARKLGLSEALSHAMMFDTAIQQGGFKAADLNALLKKFGEEPDLDEQRKREFIAKAAIGKASNAFQRDVKARRETLIDGTGSVHGAGYDFSGWGLLAEYDENEGALNADVNAATPLVSYDGEDDFQSWFMANVKPIAKDFIPAEFLRMGRSNMPGAKCAGLNTVPPRELWENCIPLARVLQAFRDRMGVAVTVSNMYRSPAYNDCIGGATHSQHKLFRAADIVAAKGTPRTWKRELQKLRAEGVFSGGIGLYSSFVHVDVRGRNANWTG